MAECLWLNLSCNRALAISLAFALSTSLRSPTSGDRMPKLSTSWSKLRWSLAQRGLRGTLRAVLQRTQPAPGAHTTPRVHPFDRRYGVDTSGLIGGDELRSGHRHDVFNTAYYGMAPSRFRQVMERWVPGESYPPIA